MRHFKAFVEKSFLSLILGPLNFKYILTTFSVNKMSMFLKVYFQVNEFENNSLHSDEIHGFFCLKISSYFILIIEFFSLCKKICISI